MKRTPHKVTSPGNTTTGVTIVEFALVSIIFFIVLYGLVEIARFYTIQALAEKGAQEAVELAQKAARFDLDPRDEASVSSEDYDLFRMAREEIANRAVRYVRLAYVDSQDPNPATGYPPSGRRAWIVKYSNVDRLSSSSVNSTALPALILRPGEKGQYTDPYTNTTYEVDHPDVTYGERPAGGDGSMEVLLRTHPIFVEVRVAVRPIFRLDLMLGNSVFSNMYAIGRAAGYTTVMGTNFASAVAAPGQSANRTTSPTPTPTPSQTPPPTISPTPPPSMTSTPVPTRSPTPPITATRTPAGTPPSTPPNTPQATVTRTPAGTPPGTPPGTPGATTTRTPRSTPGGTPPGTPGATGTRTPRGTPGGTPSAASTPPGTPPGTPGATQTRTPRSTPPGTPPGTPGATQTRTAARTPSVPPTTTPGPTITRTPASTPPVTPSVTPPVTQTRTPVPTPSKTPSVSATPSPSETPCYLTEDICCDDYLLNKFDDKHCRCHGGPCNE